MRCLYCDRPLALLKRLTGDGEFCSKEHRQIYQKEHNRLALARLLEAQPSSKGKQRSENSRNGRQALPPAAPKPDRQREEQRQPERAGFISEFLREASAVSTAHRTYGPLFQAAPPLLGDAEGQAPWRGGLESQPRTAAFLPEAPARPFVAEVCFPGKAVVQPLAGLPRLAEEWPTVD